MSLEQIIRSAHQVGFRGEDLVTATAVALAESSGNPQATNRNNNRTTDYGLWQINSVHTGAGFDPSKAFDPLYNAQWAKKLHDERGWQPWVVYNRGTYKKHLDRARQAVSQFEGRLGDPVTGGGGQPGGMEAFGGDGAALPDDFTADDLQGPQIDDGALLSAVLGQISSQMRGEGRGALGEDWWRPDPNDPFDQDEVARILGQYGQQGIEIGSIEELLAEPGDTAVPSDVPEGLQPSVQGDAPSGKVGEFINILRQSLGVPYKWGGTNLQTGVDCSGLIQSAARLVGVNVPRVSRDQARAGQPVKGLAQARAGDLIAFPSRGLTVGHIGVLIGKDNNGNWQMLHAPRSGKTVEIVPVGNRKIAAIRRIFGGGTADPRTGAGGGGTRAV